MHDTLALATTYRFSRARGWAACALAVTALGVMPGVARAADEIHWTLTGQTSVTFDWRGSESTMDLGTVPGSYSRTVTAAAPSPMPNSSTGPFWEAKVTGLTENTRYYYRIGAGAEHSFYTSPPRGSAGFWFVHEADIGSSLSYSGVVPNQQQLAADNPNIPGDDRPRFIVETGDLTYGDQNGVRHVDQHFNDVMVWSQEAAYMVAWGNHEWGSSVDDLQNYEGRFDFPNSKTSPGAPSSGGPGEDWYWFDYGNARFIAIPEPYSGAWSDWSTKADPIMAEAQNDPAIRYIVTYGHRPAYSSGADHTGEASLATILKNLHTKYAKFVLDLAGHSHHYERTDPAQTDGITHIVSGGGGSSLGGLASSQPAWSVYRMNHIHHMKFLFGADRIEGYCVCGPAGAGNTSDCVANTIVDQFVIPAPGGPVSDAVAPQATRNLRVN